MKARVKLLLRGRIRYFTFAIPTYTDFGERLDDLRDESTNTLEIPDEYIHTRIQEAWSVDHEDYRLLTYAYAVR